MITEEKLAGWTGPSSPTEKEKQERTERMIREAINEHDGFDGYRNDFSINANGSYANNTNVKSDSDVDVVVECRDVCYWQEHDPAKGGHPSGNPYTGPWSPDKLRKEVAAALEKKFPLESLRSRREKTDQVINPYTMDLVEGVIAKQEQIDEFLSTYSQGWPLERMPAVDRIILRLGSWELLYNDDVPDKVAISEAVELAKSLSTDESPAFINGLLSRLHQLKDSLLA